MTATLTVDTVEAVLEHEALELIGQRDAFRGSGSPGRKVATAGPAADGECSLLASSVSPVSDVSHQRDCHKTET